MKLISADDRLELMGLHSHIDSQISAFTSFTAAAQKTIRLRGVITREMGYLVLETDPGGGHGVTYVIAIPPGMAPHEVAGKLYRMIQDACEQYNQPPPTVSVEPGRSLVAPTTIIPYRVPNMRDRPVGTRLSGSVVHHCYATVDGEVDDNIRPALYDTHYTATLVSRLGAVSLMATHMVGAHCESGNIVMRNVALPADLAEDDLLAVPMTETCGWSMSPNCNWFTRPEMLRVW